MLYVEACDILLFKCKEENIIKYSLELLFQVVLFEFITS